MKKWVLLFLVFYHLPGKSFAQGNLDSLEHIISLGKKDQAEAEALNKLAEIYGRKDYAKAKFYLQASYNIAKGLTSQRPLGVIYFHYINLFQNTGNIDSASYYLGKLAALAQQANPKEREHIQANYYHSAGLYHKKKGEIKESILFYKKALELPINKNKSDAGTAGLYLNLGNAYSIISKPKEALQNHLIALEIFERLDNKLGKSFCYQAIGLSYGELGQLDRSLVFAKKSLDIKLAIGDKRSITTAYNSIGSIYLDQDKYDNAIENFEKSLELAREMNLVADEQRALFNIGKAYADKNEGLKANDYFKQSRVLSTRIGDTSFVILVDGELNKLASKKEEKLGFEKKLVGSVELLDARGDMKTKIAVYRNTADYYTSTGDFEKALSYTNKYYQLYDSLKSSELQFQFRQMEEQFNSDKKENEIALLKKDKLIDKGNLQQQKILKYAGYSISLLLLLMSIFIFKRIRMGQQVKELKLRNQIAADLHDEVGSSLSSIHLLSQMAELKETNPGAKNILNKMTNNVHETIERMSDIVWVVKPKINDTQSLKTRMENFMYEICDGKEIEGNFSSDDMAHLNLTMEQRKNLYLIFKEGVNNAVKYSGTKKLDVNVVIKGNLFEMCIKDYGKGFDTHTCQRGNGLENMLGRAKEMHADLQINSLPGQGTQINLQVKL